MKKLKCMNVFQHATDDENRTKDCLGDEVLLFQHGHFSLFTQWLGSPEIVLPNLHASFSGVEPPIFRVISIQTSCRTCVTLVRCQISCHVRCHTRTPGSGDSRGKSPFSLVGRQEYPEQSYRLFELPVCSAVVCYFLSVIAKTCAYYLQKAFKMNVTTNILLV